MADDDPDSRLDREEAVGVGLVVEVGHDLAVVEVEVEGAGRVVAVGGGVWWAEPLPFTTIVECDHCDVGGT